MEARRIGASVVVLLAAESEAARCSMKLLEIKERGFTSDTNRLQSLIWRLHSERLRLLQWCNTVGLDGRNVRIDPDQMRVVEDMSGELRHATVRVAGRLDTFTVVETSSMRRRLRTAARWAGDGYDETRNMVDLMHALNELLVTRVPVLPAYSAMTRQDDRGNRAYSPAMASPDVEC